MPPEALTKARTWHAGTPAELAGTSRDRLTFLSWAGQGVRSRKTYWRMACTCGIRFIMRQDSLAKSCGCLNAELIADGSRIKRRELVVEIDGKRMSLAAAIRYSGLPKQTVRMRRERLGWPPERWFEPPGRMSHRKRRLWKRRQKKRERERAHE